MKIVNRTVLAGLVLSVIATMTPAWAATPAVDVPPGYGASFIALEQNGTPLSWFGNALPTPINLNQITTVSSLFLKGDGTIWGLNGVQVQPALSGVKQLAKNVGAYALKIDGTVWDWGINGTGSVTTPVQITGLTNVVSITSSASNLYEYVNFAIKSDGTVWVWGYDNIGLFGNGQNVNGVNTAPNYVPTQILRAYWIC